MIDKLKSRNNHVIAYPYRRFLCIRIDNCLDNFIVSIIQGELEPILISIPGGTCYNHFELPETPGNPRDCLVEQHPNLWDTHHTQRRKCDDDGAFGEWSPHVAGCRPQ
jgi:hypothetical protein